MLSLKTLLVLRCPALQPQLFASSWQEASVAVEGGVHEPG